MFFCRIVKNIVFKLKIFYWARISFMKKQNCYLMQNDLVDHAKHPKNYGLYQVFDFVYCEHNLSCGDSVTVCGLIQDDILQDVRFEGKGCMLNFAMASKVTEFVKGKSIEEILSLDNDIVIKLLGLELGPTRIQCAMISVNAIVNGVLAYKSNKNNL